jgi:hypothetical protein
MEVYSVYHQINNLDKKKVSTTMKKDNHYGELFPHPDYENRSCGSYQYREGNMLYN